MPSAASRRMYEDQIPSFMSILDPEAANIDDRGLVTVVDSKYMGMDPVCGPKMVTPQPPQQHKLAQGQIVQHQQHLRPLAADPAHRHNDSTSTQNSESAGSSPTTTLTTDTSSLSDPSPSSSPDSPITNNLIPLNSYPATNFGALPSTMNNLTVNDSGSNLLNAAAPANTPNTNQVSNLSLRPVTSPSPRRRNMKGLSIQPPFGGNHSANLVSEPSSPSFIKPQIPSMKKKPSNLSLKTDAAGLNLGGRPGLTLATPSSPGLPPILQRRSLKHSTSSPHMLSGMKSSTFGPPGGMGFPSLGDRGTSGLSEALRPQKSGLGGPTCESTIMEEEPCSPIRAQHAELGGNGMDLLHDESENNEDHKSPGYPDGPIAIYDDNVFLYLEPNAEEAAKFDLVINVAREVKNPFEAQNKSKSPTPDTAMTADSFATAFEYPPSNERSSSETPTTPRANPFHEPEYIHMKWDHSTDIAPELMALCEKIEKTVQQGKRVLIHCQQGASRSASLIIAYGLYKNPGQSVNDAYYKAQAKSKWISPNMKLMYCLQDFQKEVSQKRQPPKSAAGPRTGRNEGKHRLTHSASEAIDIKSKEPLSAPLPDETAKATANSPDRSGSHSRGKSTPNLDAITPGPSSAPSSFSWSEKIQEKEASPRIGGSGLRMQSLGDTLQQSPQTPTEPSSQFLKPPQPHSEPKRKLKMKPSMELRPAPKHQRSMVELKTKHAPESIFSPTSTDFPPPPPIPSSFGFQQLGGIQSFGFSSVIRPTTSAGPEAPIDREISMDPAFPAEDALMSPRAETMTNNPLHDSFSELAGMKFVEQPPTPANDLFSPRANMFPRDSLRVYGRPTQVADPRSPPTKGETPITRSIDDVL